VSGVHVVVEPAVDERVSAQHELVALVELTTTHDADEAPDVVDLVDGSHHELVRRDQLQAARATHPEQPANDDDMRAADDDKRAKRKYRKLQLFGMFKMSLS